MIIKANRVIKTKREIRTELESAICRAAYAIGEDREELLWRELMLVARLCKAD